MGPEALQELLTLWDLTRTGSLEDPGKPGEEESPRLTQASLRHTAQAEEDEHRAVLPRLLEQLRERERQLIEALYLQEPALIPAQGRRQLGITPRQLRALEAEALRRLRAAAYGVELER